MNEHKKGYAKVSPSLALIKYWGKADNQLNLPATSSLSLNLSDFYTQTEVFINGEGKDHVYIADKLQPANRFEQFFNNLRDELNSDVHFTASSDNNFPTAAGLASSSSGFATLTAAIVQVLGMDVPLSKMSSIARIGSASAARAFFGGYALFPAGSFEATPLYPASYWPELRIVVAKIKEVKKDISSRDAMEQTRTTSPFYQGWVDNSFVIIKEALCALENRDLQKLGELMRQSYMSMFGSMLGANPPILYWESGSVEVIKLCAKMRKQGIAAWETMDAGPQVKIITVDSQVDVIKEQLHGELGLPLENVIITKPGEGVQVWS